MRLFMVIDASYSTIKDGYFLRRLSGNKNGYVLPSGPTYRILTSLCGRCITHLLLYSDNKNIVFSQMHQTVFCMGRFASPIKKFDKWKYTYSILYAKSIRDYLYSAKIYFYIVMCIYVCVCVCVCVKFGCK